MKKYITGLLLLAFTVPSWAETMLQFNCSFPFFSDQNAAKQTQKSAYTSVFIVTADDNGELSAVISGSEGAASLLVIADKNIINLFEVTPSSIVNITTLQPDFELGTAKAVHSRHAVLPEYGYWNPTQFYGECVIK